MISYEAFGKLHLKDFTFEDELTTLENWEFMSRTWVGESLNFTEFLRLASDPQVTRSVAIDFDDFLTDETNHLMTTLGLPLRQCMPIEEMKSLLGEPVSFDDRVEDRITYEYVLPGPPRYHLSCTVTQEDGLIYLVMLRP